MSRKQNEMIRTASGRARTAAVLAIAGALLAPAGASAAGETLSTTATTAAITDGKGTIAFGTGPGTLRIVAPGGTVDAAVPPECQPLEPAAVGGGQVALACSVRRPEGGAITEPRLVDAATGEVRVPAGIDQLIVPSLDAHVIGVGSVGLAMSFSFGKGSATRAVDWRSGAPLPVPGERREDAAQALDLDSAAGVQTMCSPLRRAGDELNAWWTFADYAYAKPYGAFSDLDDSRLLLQRCGAKRPTAIGPAATGRMTLGSDLLTVSGAGDEPGFTYMIGCGLRLTWQVGVVAGHVRGAAILSGREAEGPWEIRRVPLAGVCDRARTALRLELRAAGMAVRAAPRAATWPEAAIGATATQVTGLEKAAPQLRLATGGTAAVASGRALTRLQWRTGGAWKSARRAGRRWTIAAPGLRSARTATVRATSPGATGTFAVRLLPPRR